MFNKKDTTFDELRERSFNAWLDNLENHEDLEVRGGVLLAKDYINSLKQEIALLKEKNDLKDEYLKKLKNKYK